MAEQIDFLLVLKENLTATVGKVINSVKALDKVIKKTTPSLQGALDAKKMSKAALLGFGAVKGATIAAVGAIVHATAEADKFRSRLELLTGSSKAAEKLLSVLDAIRPAFKGTEGEMQALVDQSLKLGFGVDELKNILPLAFDAKAISGSQEAAAGFLSLMNKLALGAEISGKEIKFLAENFGVTVKEGIKGVAAMKAVGDALTAKRGGVAGAASVEAAKSLDNLLQRAREIPLKFLEAAKGSKAFETIQAAIANLLDLIGPGSDTFEDIKAAFQGVADFIATEFFEPLTGRDAKKRVRDFAQGLITFLKFLPDLIRTVSQGIQNFGSILVALVGTLKILAIANPFGALAAAVGGLVLAGVHLIRNWDDVRIGFGLLVTDLLTFVGDVARRIKEGVMDLVSWAKEIGKEIIGGLVFGITSEVATIKDAIKGAVGGAIDSAKGLLKIQSPSKVFEDIGKATGAGFAGGIEDSARTVEQAGAGTFSAGRVTARAGVGTRIGGVTLNVNVDGGSLSSPEAFSARLSEILPSMLASVFEDIALEQGATNG